MRKKTHNLYIQLSHTGHRLWKPTDLRLCLLAQNSFLLALLLALQCWLSTVLPLIKKEGLSSKLRLIVTTISQPRRWSQSSNLTIAVHSFIFYYVACLNLNLGSPTPFSAMSAGSSSAASLDSRLDDSNTIWSYIRSLHGVIGVLYQPMPTSCQSASLGNLADDYLHAHGYTLPAIDFIVTTTQSSASVEDFIDVLTMHGFARTEAKFLWHIIDFESKSD